MSNFIDYIENTWVEFAKSSDDTTNTVSHAAEAGKRHVVTKVDASFETSTTTGILTLKFGTIQKGGKDIHGAGALDYGTFGLLNPTANQKIEAELPAGGANEHSHITMSGFTIDST